MNQERMIGGSGLGLAISKMIIERHGGKLILKLKDHVTEEKKCFFNNFK